MLPQTKAFLQSNKITISLEEYFLKTFREPGKPAYLSFNSVDVLMQIPDWQNIFTVIYKKDLQIKAYAELALLDKDMIFQVWLKEEFERSNLAKDSQLEVEKELVKNQKAELEELNKELHIKTIKVRQELLKRGAGSEVINRLISLALNPYAAVLGDSYINANFDSLTTDQRAQIKKGLDLRVKFGLNDILKKLGK